VKLVLFLPVLKSVMVQQGKWCNREEAICGSFEICDERRNLWEVLKLKMIKANERLGFQRLLQLPTCHSHSKLGTKMQPTWVNFNPHTGNPLNITKSSSNSN
jgi:hypothetical protein